MSFREVVLLVEETQGVIAGVRPIALERPGITEILTRMPVSDTQEVTQLFRNVQGERDQTGQLRVFREVRPDIAVPPEEPQFDERVVKFDPTASKITTR